MLRASIVIADKDYQQDGVQDIILMRLKLEYSKYVRYSIRSGVSWINLNEIMHGGWRLLVIEVLYKIVW